MKLPWNKGRLALIVEIARGQYFRFTLTVLATILAVFFQFVTPQIIRVTVDNIIDELPSSPLISSLIIMAGGREALRENLYICFIAAALTALLTALTDFIRQYYTVKIAEHIACGLRDTMFKHIQTLPYEWHVKVQTGDIIQRSTSDVDTIRNFFAQQFVELIRMSLIVIVSVTMMAMMDIRMTLFALTLMPLVFIFSLLFFRSIGRKFGKADAQEGLLQATVQENLTGVRVVRAFGRESFEIERFDEQNNKYTDLWIKIGSALGLYWGFGDIISGLQKTIVMAAGIWFCSRGDLSPGVYIAFCTYVFMLSWPVRNLGRVIAELSKAGVSSGRIKEILATQPETDSEDALTPNITGNIAFEHVSFAYPDGSYVLRDVSFTLSPGETLAILGATGSGKSTLVQLICRLYDVSEGRILLDGIDIKLIKRSHIRKAVGLVMKEPFLFSKTIYENISISHPNPKEEHVHNAAKTACIHDVIESFSDGYSTIVGERGVTLSGGQKQRVAIARMLVNEGQIMIFDDSLSAVDTETESKIRHALKSKTASRSTIIISHRTSTLMRADKIMVLRDGEIEEIGSHNELMNNHGSYRRIFDLQSGADKLPDNNKK